MEAILDNVASILVRISKNEVTRIDGHYIKNYNVFEIYWALKIDRC